MSMTLAVAERQGLMPRVRLLLLLQEVILVHRHLSREKESLK